MEKLVIAGGTPLKGEVTISGAKNAAVAILPATLLINGICTIENLPNISDVKSKFMQRGNLVLGFSNIAEDQISKVWPGDDRTPMIQSPIEQRELQYNTFKNIEDLSDKNKLQYSNYSEIVMNRYINDENGELTKYPPNYLLITDGVIKVSYA